MLLSELIHNSRINVLNTIWYHLYVESKIQHKHTVSAKQKQTDSDIENRLVVAKGEEGVEERSIGSLGLAEANQYIYRMDKQQGPIL